MTTQAAAEALALPVETLHGLYRDMWRIRRFEETALYHSTQGDVYGALHLYIGEEATAVGVCSVLRRDDYVASTHRGHGHCIAKGARMDRMMAELSAAPPGPARARAAPCTSPTSRAGCSAPTASSARASAWPRRRPDGRGAPVRGRSPSPSSATGPRPGARSTRS